MITDRDHCPFRDGRGVAIHAMRSNLIAKPQSASQMTLSLQCHSNQDEIFIFDDRYKMLYQCACGEVGWLAIYGVIINV